MHVQRMGVFAGRVDRMKKSLSMSIEDCEIADIFFGEERSSLGAVNLPHVTIRVENASSFKASVPLTWQKSTPYLDFNEVIK